MKQSSQRNDWGVAAVSFQPSAISRMFGRPRKRKVEKMRGQKQVPVPHSFAILASAWDRYRTIGRARQVSLPSVTAQICLDNNASSRSSERFVRCNYSTLSLYLARVTLPFSMARSRHEDEFRKDHLWSML